MATKRRTPQKKAETVKEVVEVAQAPKPTITPKPNTYYLCVGTGKSAYIAEGKELTLEGSAAAILVRKGSIEIISEA